MIKLESRRRIISFSGGTANPGGTTFNSISNGTFSAGIFTSAADASGILLNYTPAALPPLPVLTANLASAGPSLNATISWSATSGIEYQVQYKTNLNQTGWLVLTNVTATGNTASCVDPSALEFQRYYQVRFAP